MAVEAKKQTNAQWGAWIWIKWKAGAPEDACNTWKNIKEVKEAWSMTGKWDCALWVVIQTPEEIEKFVWKEIRGNEWVGKTQTHLAKKYW